MVLIPKDFTNIDRNVLEVRAARLQNSKRPKIPKDTAIAVRQLFQEKLYKMLKNGSAQSDSANITRTLEGNSVEPQITNEHGVLSHDAAEAEVAEILTILEDDPARTSLMAPGLLETGTQSTRHWIPNPEGVGLNWNLRREQIVTGLLTGKQSFDLIRSEWTRYIPLSGWRARVVVTFPVNRDSSIYMTADISPPGTQQEHTCFESNLPPLCRLAFRVRTVSPSGESIFWAERVNFESQDMLQELLDRLIRESDDDKEEK
jgi:hypothetical protein